MFKIPTQARQVFAGVIFDVYQREQMLFDGSKTTFEMARRPDGVKTIVVKDNKILFTKQQQPDSPNRYYVFPGGRLQDDEEPLEGAKRELQEETGIISEDFLYYASYPRMYKVEYQQHLFIAYNPKETKQCLDGGEKVQMIRMNFEEMIEIIFSEGYGFTPFANHLFRLERQNKMDEFKKVLYK